MTKRCCIHFSKTLKMDLNVSWIPALCCVALPNILCICYHIFIDISLMILNGNKVPWCARIPDELICSHVNAASSDNPADGSLVGSVVGFCRNASSQALWVLFPALIKTVWYRCLL